MARHMGTQTRGPTVRLKPLSLLSATRGTVECRSEKNERSKPLRTFDEFVIGGPPKEKAVRRRILVIPDNKSGKVWYGNLATSVRTDVELAMDFPNPYDSMTKRWERIWIDSIRSYEPDSNTVLVGHGSGAEAVLRFLEDHKVLGAILVATPGDEYYAGERHGRLYRWESIKSNSGFIVQFHSENDPMGKLEEAKNVAENSGSELFLLRDRGSFLQAQFPELVEIVKAKLAQFKDT
eukprot:CAMPEP_0114514886 /NCGR_PEP_ID=MMETSP0109-20121206/16409_1 /TAXON_ID=29199 /ORGANISM="Chlorarachnion reptans, Strain CCCM449" /LENGTH=235 /DNA_ID=CAMNT_0001694989 /DNA_START=151 /DNA_END=858 /DNA_ORIENTATION=+